LVTIDRELLQSLPGPLLRLHRALPLKVLNNTLILGMEDPTDLALPETIRRLSGREVKVVQLCPDGGPLPDGDNFDQPGSSAWTRDGLQLLGSRLETRVTGLLVWVKLTQTFINQLDEPQQVQYLVPVPNEALFQGLRAVLAEDNVPFGQVQRLQLAGQCHFSISIEAVPSGVPLRLTLQYVQLVEREKDGFRLTLPCPPGRQVLESSLQLQWPGLEPQNLSCSRPATWWRESQDTVVVKLEPTEQPCNRPLILSYRHPQPEKSLQGLLLSDGQHFLLHLQAPPQPPAAPRKVIFLLDRSASLEGWGAEQGRRALVQGLRQLRPLDRFALAVFDDDLVAWQKGRWVEAGAITAAKTWLQAQAGGGGLTDLVGALEWVRHHYRDQSDLYLVLLSDGQGGHQTEALRLASSLRKELRLFTLGLGGNCQADFLKRLADLGGGSAELASSAQDLLPALRRLMQQLGQPHLTNMQLVGQGFHSDPVQQHPERLAEVFWGQQLTVLGRHQGTGPLIARGLSPQGPISLTLTPRMTDHPALASLWAQAQREGLQRRLGQARISERNRIVEQVRALERNYSLDPSREARLFQPDFWHTRPRARPEAASRDFRPAEELLEQALLRQASHIHIEQQADQVKVRLRICGKLQTVTSPFKDGQAQPLLMQFRRWCQLEGGQGQFQNGRFQRHAHGEAHLFEASFCPTVTGEKLVLEVRPASLRSHENLAEPARSAVSALFTRRRGLLLVCGPRGSGGNSLMVDWLSHQFPDRHSVLCHKEEWFGLKTASQVTPTPDLAAVLQELEGHDIDVLACTAIRQRSAWETLLRRAGERSLVLARHHAPAAGMALAELLDQGIDGRALGKVLLGALSLRRLPRLCSCKIPEEPGVLAALSGQGEFSRRAGCSLCQGEGLRGSVLCSEVLLYRTEIFSVLKPGIKPDRLEQAFIRYPMSQQLLRLAQQGIIEARHCLSPSSIF
ncbi:MAG: ATPase, T2SS/T4P/T4SS family, partial [Vulcanimicrobiota bacterium]